MIERLEARALLASISGMVFEDANGNGVPDDGDGGLAGVTVYLDQNHNGKFDAGETSTTSAANGAYVFENLLPGAFTVREVVPKGFVQTGPVFGDFYYATTRAVGSTPRQLVRIDAATGKAAAVGPLGIPRNLNGLARANDGSLFAIAAEGTGGDAFYSVNPDTGAATFLGNTGMEVAFGLAYDSASDTIYGIGLISPGLQGLVTYNRATGKASPVSSLAAVQPSTTNGIAFDSVKSRVLAYNFADGQIYGFHPTTGERSTLAKIPSGLSANLAFAGGQLVMKKDFAGQGNEFLAINPDTGQIASLFFATTGVAFESLEFVDPPQFAHQVTLIEAQNAGGRDFGNRRVNASPAANAGGPYVIREGQGLTLDATASTDPDGDALTYAWDLDGDGQFDDAAGAEVALSWSQLVAMGVADDGAYPVFVRVADELFTGEASTTILVENAPPMIVAAHVSAANVGDAAPGRSVTLSARFTDPGPRDTHAAMIDWGDGVVSAGKVSKGTISGSHRYRQGGVYTVSVSVADDDGGADARSVTAYVTGVRVANRVLQIVGTRKSDSVSITLQGKNRLEVRAGFLARRGVAMDRARVSSLEVYLGGGNDSFTTRGKITQPLLVVGGAGDDVIMAGSGRSLLIGGTGADRLNGGSNQDLLIAGATAFDNHPAALRALLAEWSSARSLQQRVANLVNGSGSASRANGDYFLTVGQGGTVADDRQSDILNGGASSDWLFFDPRLDRGRNARDDLFANNLASLLG